MYSGVTALFSTHIHCSLEGIHGDEVDVSHPLLGCGVAVFINLPHDSAQVHGLGDNLIVVWHLGR